MAQKEVPAGLQTHNWKRYPKKDQFGDRKPRTWHSKVHFLQYVKTIKGHPLRKQLSTQCHKHLSNVPAFHHCGLHFNGRCVWRKVKKKAAGNRKHWTRRCCQTWGLLPISYGNQCSRMQSIAKQVTLALTASHKTVKSHGCLAATPAWEQKRGNKWWAE